MNKRGNQMETVSLTEFDAMLKRHDWYYQYSDDYSVYRSGKSEQDRLVGIARNSPEHQELMTAWGKFHFTGDPWKTPKFTKEMLDEVRANLGISVTR
jgi:hypothetical protein